MTSARRRARSGGSKAARPGAVPPLPADLVAAAESADTYVAACRRYGWRPEARYRHPRADLSAAELARRRRRSLEVAWRRDHGADPFA